jgi:hypothetical protein
MILKKVPVGSFFSSTECEMFQDILDAKEEETSIRL